MKPSIIFLALIPFVVGQQTLLSFDGESNFDHFKECEDPSLLSCRKVRFIIVHLNKKLTTKN